MGKKNIMAQKHLDYQNVFSGRYLLKRYIER